MTRNRVKTYTAACLDGKVHVFRADTYEALCGGGKNCGPDATREMRSVPDFYEEKLKRDPCGVCFSPESKPKHA